MPKLAVAWICTALPFMAMDAGFLSFVGPRLYRPALDVLLAGTVRPAPAVLFYLLYTIGLTAFCVRPALTAGWRSALTSGAGFGLVAYGTYDLTCQAVMRGWTWQVSAADMAWGAFASGCAATVGTLAGKALARRQAPTVTS